MYLIVFTYFVSVDMFAVGLQSLSIGSYETEFRLWAGVVCEYLVGLTTQQAQQGKLVWWDWAVQLQMSNDTTWLDSRTGLWLCNYLVDIIDTTVEYL